MANLPTDFNPLLGDDPDPKDPGPETKTAYGQDNPGTTDEGPVTKPAGYDQEQ